jgi:hypothetical protein
MFHHDPRITAKQMMRIVVSRMAPGKCCKGAQKTKHIILLSLPFSEVLSNAGSESLIRVAINTAAGCIDLNKAPIVVNFSPFDH